VIPYAAVWARVRELLAMSEALLQEARMIRRQAEQTRCHLEALRQHAERLWVSSQGHQEEHELP
jgi:hypothetical protein